MHNLQMEQTCVHCAVMPCMGNPRDTVLVTPHSAHSLCMIQYADMSQDVRNSSDELKYQKANEFELGLRWSDAWLFGFWADLGFVREV